MENKLYKIGRKINDKEFCVILELFAKTTPAAKMSVRLSEDHHIVLSRNALNPLLNRLRQKIKEHNKAKCSHKTAEPDMTRHLDLLMDRLSLKERKKLKPYPPKNDFMWMKINDGKIYFQSIAEKEMRERIHELKYFKDAIHIGNGVVGLFSIRQKRVIPLITSEEKLSIIEEFKKFFDKSKRIYSKIPENSLSLFANEFAFKFNHKKPEDIKEALLEILESSPITKKL